MDPREYDWSVTAKTAAGKLLVISGLVADHEQQAPVTAEELNATVGLLREFAATWNSGIAVRMAVTKPRRYISRLTAYRIQKGKRQIPSLSHAST
jgi:hypothetical protein